MKSVMIAAAALVAFASAASAFERPTVLSYGEYKVEAETFELGAGTEFVLGNGIVLTPMIVALDTANDNFDFDRAELNVSYGVNQNVDLYATIETDADLDYSETTLGFKIQY